ncbi:hypothetical protein EVAR_24898_1 [Eumeta japonica]|uniref:Uncharacterized protein n=1 Tax=Eumeta variegata TaxID=151549 RepID=A0A4C1V7J7_EUMVA|nr:hypothetical protein EVAR_24898_1 [Eumeta japonica]
MELSEWGKVAGDSWYLQCTNIAPDVKIPRRDSPRIFTLSLFDASSGLIREQKRATESVLWCSRGFNGEYSPLVFMRRREPVLQHEKYIPPGARGR